MEPVQQLDYSNVPATLPRLDALLGLGRAMVLPRVARCTGLRQPERKSFRIITCLESDPLAQDTTPRKVAEMALRLLGSEGRDESPAL